jgi:hypothetical protein
MCWRVSLSPFRLCRHGCGNNWKLPAAADLQLRESRGQLGSMCWSFGSGKQPEHRQTATSPSRYRLVPCFFLNKHDRRGHCVFFVWFLSCSNLALSRIFFECVGGVQAFVCRANAQLNLGVGLMVLFVGSLRRASLPSASLPQRTELFNLSALASLCSCLLHTAANIQLTTGSILRATCV